MKKITFFTYTLAHGGTLRQMTLLANRFIKEGYEVSIIFACRGTDYYGLDKKIRMVELFEFVERTSLFRVVPKLSSAMRKLNSDVYVSFLDHSNVQLLLANVFAQKKVILAEQTDPRFYKLEPLWENLKKTLYPLASGFIFQTKQQKVFYSKIIQKKSTVIPNPISQNLPDECMGMRKKEIVATGRLAPEKNYPLLFKAFSEVIKKHPEYTLHIYGKGHELLRLRLEVKRLGLTDKIIFEGFRKDVFNRMSDAALYVMSSDFEGMPNSLMEAMALGLPIISTAPETGGARELVKHGHNGLLVPVGDKNALAEAILTLLEDEQLASRLSKEALKIRETHNIDKVFRKWEKTLHKIAGDSKHKHI